MAFLYLDGTLNYAKLSEKTMDKKFDCWVVDFYPTRESDAALRETGINLKQRFDDEGRLFYKLRRRHTKTIGKGDDADVITFGPPAVVIATGEVDENGVPKVEPFTDLIGNGSEATVKISIYGEKMVGHTLEGVRINKLVPYSRPEGPMEAKVAKKRTAETPF